MTRKRIFFLFSFTDRIYLPRRFHADHSCGTISKRTMPTARNIALLVIAVSGFANISCSTFHRDWEDPAIRSVGSGIEGKWDGSWRSNTNQHSGDLRCIVSPSKEKPGLYEFRYWGTFAGFLRFHYTVEYSARRSNDTWTMEGESDLGIMGGKFYHKAIVRDGTFDATYTSKWDNGTFRLKRPEAIQD